MKVETCYILAFYDIFRVTIELNEHDKQLFFFLPFRTETRPSVSKSPTLRLLFFYAVKSSLSFL